MKSTKPKDTRSKDGNGTRGFPAVASDVAAKLASVAGDVALVLDPSGVIRSVTFSGADPLGSSADDWVGQPWVDTVTSETRIKIAELLEEASTGGISRQRQVN